MSVMGRSAGLGTMFVGAIIWAVPGSAMDLNGFQAEPGEWTVALSYSGEHYEEFWRGTEKVRSSNLGTIETISSSVWLDWGVAPNVDIVAGVPWVEVSCDGPAGLEEDGLQDLTLMGRYRAFSSGSHRILLGAGVRTPLSDYDSLTVVGLGDHTTDVLTRLTYQWTRPRFYLSQQLGYDIRSGAAPDGYPLYSEVGVFSGPVTWGVFYSKLITPDGTDLGQPGATFPSNRQQYDRAGVKAYGRINGSLGVSLHGFTTLAGRNVGETSGVSVGMAYGF